MNKVLLVMHDSSGSFYRMNKTAFETMPVAGQYIYNSDGLAYVVEEVCRFGKRCDCNFSSSSCTERFPGS